MQAIKTFLIAFLFILNNGHNVDAQGIENKSPGTEKAKDASKIQWFRDAKFGLFIHWGLYSKLGGEWKGERYYGSGEWIMNQAKISAKEYARIANDFNPVDFNAEKWALLAKDAGVKYMVITAKHHEGFSMFDSKISRFNICLLYTSPSPR